MLLIDDRTPPPAPGPPRRVWYPDWRPVAYVAAAIVLGVAAASTAGIVSFVLLCATVGSVALALTRALPYGEGLREYRQ